MSLIKIWRYLTSPLFAGWLLFNCAWTCLLLLLNKFQPYRSIIFSLILFSLALLLMNRQQSLGNELLESSTLTQQRSTTDSRLIKLQKQLESLLQQQPTHRDALVNLSRIYQSLGKTDQAQNAWQQAKKLDPNHPLLQN